MLTHPRRTVIYIDKKISFTHRHTMLVTLYRRCRCNNKHKHSMQCTQTRYTHTNIHSCTFSYTHTRAHPHKYRHTYMHTTQQHIIYIHTSISMFVFPIIYHCYKVPVTLPLTYYLFTSSVTNISPYTHPHTPSPCP